VPSTNKTRKNVFLSWIFDVYLVKLLYYNCLLIFGGNIMKKELITIILGSDSDLAVLEGGVNLLEKAGVPYDIIIASAHRALPFLQKTIREKEKKGTKVFIAAAGMAAALPGVVAAETTAPVIGIPIDSSALKGADALYSIVQMPGGVPVATVAIGKAGALNAAILAVEILAISDKKLKMFLKAYRKEMYEGIIKKSAKLKAKGFKKYLAEQKN
jgi:5-(carboxyamino)imidazole ribonucleotide mutase